MLTSMFCCVDFCPRPTLTSCTTVVPVVDTVQHIWSFRNKVIGALLCCILTCTIMFCVMFCTTGACCNREDRMDGPSFDELISVKPIILSDRVRRYVIRRGLLGLKLRFLMKLGHQALGLLLGLACLVFAFSVSIAALGSVGTAAAVHDVTLSNNMILNLSNCVRGNETDTWFYLWEPPLLQVNVTRTNVAEQMLLHTCLDDIVSSLLKIGSILVAALLVMAASEFVAQLIPYRVWRRFVETEDDMTYTSILTEYLQLTEQDIEEFHNLNNYFKHRRMQK